MQAKVVQSTATPVSVTSAATLPGGSTLSHTTVSIKSITLIKVSSSDVHQFMNVSFSK